MNRKRGRPVLDDAQKSEKERLKKLFWEYSFDALETIVELMHNSFDESIKLKASTYVLNKVVADGILMFDNSDQREMKITLVRTVPNKETASYEEQQEMINQVEQEENKWNDWEIGVNDNDDWGNEVYDPE